MQNQNVGESISDYIVALKKLSIHCNYGKFWTQALRDRFVCVLNNVKTQNKLLNTPSMTFDRRVRAQWNRNCSKKDEVIPRESNVCGSRRVPVLQLTLHINSILVRRLRKKQEVAWKRGLGPLAAFGGENKCALEDVFGLTFDPIIKMATTPRSLQAQ